MRRSLAERERRRNVYSIAVNDRAGSPGKAAFLRVLHHIARKVAELDLFPLRLRLKLQAASVRRSGDNVFQLPVYFLDSLFRRGTLWYRNGVGVFLAVFVGQVEAERGVPLRSSRLGELGEDVVQRAVGGGVMSVFIADFAFIAWLLVGRTLGIAGGSVSV